MTYDNYGNILTKNGNTYTYGNSAWKDRLTAYNGQTILYDAQGNPTEYLGNVLTWEKGRQLKSFCENTYTYNANGTRTSKTVNGVKHTYALDGAKILRETWGSNTLIPLYDAEEAVCGIIYNGTPFYFLKNLQGDIISICNASGTDVAHYTYDAWGVCTITQDTSGCNIANINPYRYRGYYYDPEIGMYYLQSRYYDPVVGRFINADDAETIEMVGPQYTSSLFAYVNNNPVVDTDEEGSFSVNFLFGFLEDIFSKVVSRIKSFFASLFKVENGKLYISTTIISTTIDLIISILVTRWVSGTIKGILKNIARWYFTKGNIKAINFAKKIIQWFTKNKIGKWITKALFKVMVSIATRIALGTVGLKKPIGTLVDSIVDGCISSILSFENKLAQRISSLISAFSSLGGFIGFLFDLSDFEWDDYWAPQPLITRIVSA